MAEGSRLDGNEVFVLTVTEMSARAEPTASLTQDLWGGVFQILALLPMGGKRIYRSESGDIA